MLIRLYQFVRPDPTRPFLLDLGLASSLLCAWFVLQGFEPLIAAAAEELRLVVRISTWRAQWPPGPWAIGFVALLLAWLRHRFTGAGPQLQVRLQRITLLTALLLILRLAALRFRLGCGVAEAEAEIRRLPRRLLFGKWRRPHWTKSETRGPTAGVTPARWRPR